MALAALVVVYQLFDPAKTDYFPKCPFKYFTGLDCPGCGSQRAVHNLLNFNILGAFNANGLLVISIPYILTGFLFDVWPNNSPSFLRWRKRLFGTTAIWLIFSIVVLFWIGRNII